MRFMMIVKASKDSEAGRPPSPELMAAIAKLSEEGVQNGAILDSGGLAPSAQGARIRIGGGEMRVIDGPFAEAKELVGGYAVMQFNSRQEAIESGKRFMGLHQDILGPSYDGELEIRQIFGPEDFKQHA